MYKVKRAIVMAAGMGKRLQPVTLAAPKPLLEVNGVRIIDTIMNGLHENGISEIYIVVGYMKEKFKYLEEYPGVSLVDNPYYDTCNNVSSLYAVRDYIEDAVILDGDQIIYNASVLAPEFECSGYNAVWTEHWTDEWLLTVEHDIITHCSRSGGSGGWQLFGISRWNAADGRKLRRHVEMEFEKKRNVQIYWDDIALFHYPAAYQLGIHKMQYGDVIEVDTFSELAALDKSYAGCAAGRQN